MAAASVGRYRLVERIAQGGMGEVYRAIDLGFGGIERTVAVKRISPELARNEEFAKTFVNEAKLSFLLGHSNVVRVIDVGDQEGLYLVLEWIHGGDLGTLMATLRRDSGQSVPTRLALTIAAEVARGLDYAHRLLGPDGGPLGLVHRDVSPSNILLSVEGEVKVTDFGIARSRMRRSVSMPGQLKGKLFYMAPEQARGEEIDARADVFALGAVLYEMLAGANPFLVTGPEGDLLDRVREGSFPSLGQTVPQTAPELVAIVERAMAVDREARFPSARELRLALIDHAVQNGYALSLDELGEFVRTLAQSGLATPTAPITRPGSRARAYSDPGLSLPPEEVEEGAPDQEIDDRNEVADDPLETRRWPRRRTRRPLALIEGGKTVDARTAAREERPAPPTTPMRRLPSLGTSVPPTRRGPTLALLTLIVVGLFGLLGAKLLRLGARHDPPVHSDGSGWPSAPAPGPAPAK